MHTCTGPATAASHRPPRLLLPSPRLRIALIRRNQVSIRMHASVANSFGASRYWPAAISSVVIPRPFPLTSSIPFRAARTKQSIASQGSLTPNAPSSCSGSTCRQPALLLVLPRPRPAPLCLRCHRRSICTLALPCPCFGRQSP